MSKKTRGLLIVLGVYILTFLVVYGCYDLLPGSNSLWKVFWADVLATVVVFGASLLFKNSSMYDPYWSVIPMVIAAFLMTQFPEGNEARQWIVFGLIFFWSNRLTVNWARGWSGLHEQDWRYNDLASKSGKFYWAVSFSGIHMFPTILVFLGCIPLWAAMSSTAPLGWFDLLAAAVTLVAILIEWVSDEQLKVFKKNAQPSEFITTGLWSVSRHPNYFGEITFWLGIFFCALAAEGSEVIWTIVGYVSMVLLFLFISIPMMDKRMVAKRPAYQEHMKRVPRLFPSLRLVIRRLI